MNLLRQNAFLSLFLGCYVGEATASPAPPIDTRSHTTIKVSDLAISVPEGTLERRVSPQGVLLTLGLAQLEVRHGPQTTLSSWRTDFALAGDLTLTDSEPLLLCGRMAFRKIGLASSPGGHGWISGENAHVDIPSRTLHVEVVWVPGQLLLAWSTPEDSSESEFERILATARCDTLPEDTP